MTRWCAPSSRAPTSSSPGRARTSRSAVTGKTGRVIDSRAVPFTSAEIRDWERIRGESLGTLLDSMVQSEVWKTAPAADRQKKLREKLEQANDRATDQLRNRIRAVELRRRYETVKGKAS